MLTFLATVQETVKVEPQYDDDEDVDSEDELDHPPIKRFRLQNQEDELRYRYIQPVIRDPGPGRTSMVKWSDTSR